jgi:DNA (cytosine-5)-methyltransferase 1
MVALRRVPSDPIPLIETRRHCQSVTLRRVPMTQVMGSPTGGRGQPQANARQESDVDRSIPLVLDGNTTEAQELNDVASDAPSATVLELFAGAGGLGIGLHRAGFELLDVIESDEACCRTLRSNSRHFGWKNTLDLESRDVRNIDFSVYAGRATLLSAGAPCQPFSRGGSRRGRYDDRNMLPQVVRAVSECRPQAFVIENVRGLLFPGSLSYLESIMARLRNPTVIDPSTTGSEDLYHLRAPKPSSRDAYRVEQRILDAADFGLAQHRPRLFIVGVAQGASEFHWPVGEYSRASLVEDLRDGHYWNEHPGLAKSVITRARAQLPKQPLRRRGKRWRTLRDVTTSLGPPASTEAEAAFPWHVYVPGARLYGKHTGSRVDWVAKTVKAGVHGSPGGEHILLTSPHRFRYLTVRECAELQGFPRDYVLPALRTPAMRQLGNAVPVAVAEAIGLKLHECLRASEKSAATV